MPQTARWKPSARRVATTALEAQDDIVETWDALRARRNVRQFTDQPVPDEALDRILEAGRRAPSAGNWQPWDFVVVTDRAQLVELAKVWQGAKHVAGAAAAIAIVAPEPEDDRQSALLQYDLGQATYAMTVAAADLGVGTGHAAADDQDQARTVLGFPEGRFLAYMLAVGYPSDKPLAVIERLNRRPFDDAVTADGGDRCRRRKRNHRQGRG
jgi:nitroreductase